MPTSSKHHLPIIIHPEDFHLFIQRTQTLKTRLSKINCAEFTGQMIAGFFISRKAAATMSLSLVSKTVGYRKE